VSDASVQNAGGDAGDGGDASFAQCMSGFAGCTTFDDRSGDPDAGARTVAFADFAYSPKCLQIRAGQSVTFTGNFMRHPLAQSCGPFDALEFRYMSPPSFTVTLTEPGLYGYYCFDHGNPQGQAMSGAIQVVPDTSH
jgi:plastocyanin